MSQTIQPSKLQETQKAMLQSQAERTQTDLDRQVATLRTLSLVLAILLMLSVLSDTFFSVVNGQAYSVFLTMVSVFTALIYFIVAVFLKPRSAASTVKQASILVIFLLTITVTIFLVEDASAKFSLSCLIVPLVAALIGLNLRQILIFSTIMGLVLTYSNLRQLFGATTGIEKIWSTYIIYLLIFLVVVVCVVLLVIRINRTNLSLQDQAERLRQLLLAINSTTEFGESLSRRLSGVTAELNTTSREQASNTQEQVAAVTQVTTSLEELNETANQIAGSASAAAKAANQTLNVATDVKNSSELAQSTGVRGNEAVALTIDSVGRVRNRIELLGQRLLHLTEQTRRVGAIIDIIDEIADETHLLALNASIEAAGSTGQGNAISMSGGSLGQGGGRGERFGVIAQEVKNLSDRSRESTEEVRQAITEMQGAVAAAVLVAEEGKKDTLAALLRSEIAGSVINKLNEVISNSAQGASQILGAVQEVNVRCDEISVATGQQRSANQQILVTMRSVAQVSHESAGAVSELSQTVSQVNDQLDELNLVLANSNQAVLLAMTA